MSVKEKTFSSEELLVICSEMLSVLRSELSTRGLKPTNSNLRTVIEIIDKSLPDDSLRELFIE